MRIIAGEAGGRRLIAPAGEDTRPTAEKIRGALFNILGSRVIDAEVLDLFGGTGAMALEALSRGAKHAVIVDSAHAAIKAIERNAETVLKEERSTRLRIVKSDYRSAIGTMRGLRFDIVFLDPPYRMTQAYADAVERLEAADALAEECILLLEHDSSKPIPLPQGWLVTDERRYGAANIVFLMKEKA